MNENNKKSPHDGKGRYITQQRLQNYALWYLQKQFPSKNWLRQKLQQFALRKKPSGQSMKDITPWIDEVLLTLEKENIINDDRLAKNLASQWQTRLIPFRKIAIKLHSKGFEKKTIDEVKTTLDKNGMLEDEESLAKHYAMQKKLGVFATKKITGDKHTTQKNYQKDLAKMARAGFSYHAAQKALQDK
ncbi:MAG: regulatory protein RecX [Alphaproteobacteria bacterium]